MKKMFLCVSLLMSMVCRSGYILLNVSSVKFKSKFTYVGVIIFNLVLLFDCGLSLRKNIWCLFKK